MSHGPQHDPENRDRVVARLAAETLRSGAAPGGNANPCPDAELLAAYADHSLDANEVARWESHFADCARCRKILAVLAVSEEPLASQEVQAPARRIAAVPDAAPAAEAKQPVVMRPRRMPGWLVPAFGAAIAAMLWFALRPATPPQEDLVSQSISPGDAASPEVPAVNEPFFNSPAASSEVAPSGVPPPSVSTFAAEAPGQSPAGQTLSADSASALDAFRREQQGITAGAAAPESLAAANSAPAPILAPPAPREQLLVAPAADAIAAAKTAPPAAASQNAAPADSRDGQRPVQTQTFSALASRAAAGAVAKAASPVISFASPGGTQWRAGTAGLIERSTDEGRTWQVQSSGVSLDLTAGSATSNQVAWIVGHAGVILRTTDGVSWRRIVSPNAATLDWAAVQATDALHATIVSKDQRRFITADGGQNWTPLP